MPAACRSTVSSRIASATWCGGVGQRLVVADERPRQDRHRTGQHALDGLVGQRLRIGDPLDGHRRRAVDVAVQDRRPHAPAAVGLHPAVLRGEEPVELFGEVLHHVVALGLAVHQDVEAELLLKCDDVGDLGPHPALVLGVVDLACPQRGARDPDRRRLRVRPDGRGRQRGQLQPLVLRGATLFGRAARGARRGDRRDAGTDPVVGQPRVRSRGTRSRRWMRRPRPRRLRVRPAGRGPASTTSATFSAPNASQLRSASSRSVSGVERVRHVQRRARRGDRDGARAIPAASPACPDAASRSVRQTLRPSTTPATRILPASSGTAATASTLPATRSTPMASTGVRASAGSASVSSPK